MTWPTDVVASIAIKDKEAAFNLVNVLRRGITMVSDYSGMDCPREALEQCSEAVARYFSIEADEFHLNFCRASDKGRLQKRCSHTF